MLKGTFTFIQELNRLFPITGRASHALTMEDNTTLIVTIFFGDQWQSFKLDDADLQKDPVVLANEIYNMSFSASSKYKPTVVFN